MAEELKILKRERNELLGFRLSKEEAAMVREYARSRGVSMSDVIFSALVAGGVLTREYVASDK